MNTQSLSISLNWTQDADYPDRARATIELLHVNGCPLHLEALRVIDRPAGKGTEQVSAAVEFDDDVTALQSLAGGSALCTTDLPGLTGQWIIYAHPHGA